VAAVPTGQVAAVQQAPAAGHGHAGGHGVVDGVAHSVRRAGRVPGRLVRAGQLLDTVRVLARIGADVAVRAQRLVQQDAVRHQPRAPGPGVRGRRTGAGHRRGRAGVPTVRVPVQIAYGHHGAVRLRPRPPRQPPHDHHRHTAVQRHTHQRHQARRRRGPVVGWCARRISTNRDHRRRPPTNSTADAPGRRSPSTAVATLRGCSCSRVRFIGTSGALGYSGRRVVSIGMRTRAMYTTYNIVRRSNALITVSKYNNPDHFVGRVCRGCRETPKNDL